MTTRNDAHHRPVAHPVRRRRSVPGMHKAERAARAVMYLRVSSAGQLKRDYDPEGISIPAQRTACQRKAAQLGVRIVDEYVEPARSARNMGKRLAFQQMLTRIHTAGDVDCMLVYKLSRLARNRIDDALIMADLRQRGIALVSATESIDDSPVGQLMHGILATVNEYQSRESGADIAEKMGQKARNGGTIGRARLGYLNHIDRSAGRDVRTVIVDSDRAPLVHLGFELFATGNYTLAQLADTLDERGLRTRPTRRHPAGRVSVSKLAHMLRDRYYLGYITYHGEEIPGRHPPLVDQDLFHRVQLIRQSRAVAQERRRVHHHYLKGSLFCGHCKTAGIAQRMIIQHTVNRYGAEYTYFFCHNKQTKTCASPHISVTTAEHAVEAHYALIKISSDDLAALRDRIAGIDDNPPAGPFADQEVSTAYDLYCRSSPNQRRLLNQTIFHRLYIADGHVTGHDFTAKPHPHPARTRQNQTNTPE